MSASSTDQDATLNLLILAADTAEAAQIAGHFDDATFRQVTDAADLRTALRTGPWDAALYAFNLTGLTPAGALKVLHGLDVDLPFIVVADPADEKAAARAMRSGAHDVVFRDRLGRLVPAVEREVREARYRADHRATLAMVQNSDLRFRSLAGSLPGMVFHHWAGRLRGRGRGGKWVDLRSTPQRGDDAGAGGHGIVNWQGIATNITAIKETEAALRASREQLSELSFHLEAAREQERERIARDIHDELGSFLVRLKIEATLLAAKLPAETPALREKARSIESLLDQAMGAAGRVARELRPGILKEFGLPAAIESLAEDFSQHFGITCRVHCDDDLDPDADTSLALFRIVQETLTNVAKHAHASLVVVRLKREKGSIALELRDNGRGISEADMAKPKSFGLRGIRERVHSLNGEFSISSGEHGGTHIRLRVPERRGAEPTAVEEVEDVQRKLF